jgi:hypothetical protein
MIDLDPALGQELFHVAIGEPERKYQRTARRITSGGNRKPANAELGTACAGRE